jgi:hypothetical protein
VQIAGLAQLVQDRAHHLPVGGEGVTAAV